MAIKTITVFLDDSAASDTRLAAAIALAQTHGAHLTAVACARQLDVGVYAMPGAEMAMDLTALDQSRDQAKALAARAAERMEREGITGDTRWASAIAAGLEETAARSARRSDISVVGSVGGDGPSSDVADAVFEGALFSSGRPALVLPAGWTGPIGTKVMIAWDGSHVAARAIADATPFLEAAGEATIAIVDPDPGSGRFSEQPGADIAAVIARHGVKVTIETLAKSGASAAERLQTAATDLNADLMVMGGYGHSRLREAIFSGVSRQVLEKPSLPVLVSH